MAEYLTNTTDLTKVASAIREKGGTSDPLVYPDEFVTAIQDIKTGPELQIIVTVESGANVTATKGSLSVSGTSVDGTCTLVVPEIGTWSVSATLNGQTSNTQNVSVVDSYAVELTFFSATITVTVDSGATVVLKKGGATIDTKTSMGTVVFTVYETGSYTVEATKNGQTTSGSVNVVSSTTSYALTLSFISSTLNDNEWSVIKSVSDAGQGANYWNVGDYKNIQISGTVQGMALNSTVRAFILGFNHNSAKEGSNRIHFQIGKTTSGTDIAFCDSNYNHTGSSQGFRMNLSNTNSGGWNGSYGRNILLGNRDTPTAPSANSFMEALPADLRAVMKTVTKYTDNTGGTSGSSTSVTATTDYLFFLAEFEVQGVQSYANRNEQNYQAQYDYYKAGNSKVKYRHDGTGTAVYYWCRSARLGEKNAFCRVNTNGNASYTSANNSAGLSPGFCV